MKLAPKGDANAEFSDALPRQLVLDCLYDHGVTVEPGKHGAPAILVRDDKFLAVDLPDLVLRSTILAICRSFGIRREDMRFQSHKLN